MKECTGWVYSCTNISGVEHLEKAYTLGQRYRDARVKLRIDNFRRVSEEAEKEPNVAFAKSALVAKQHEINELFDSVKLDNASARAKVRRITDMPEFKALKKERDNLRKALWAEMKVWRKANADKLQEFENNLRETLKSADMKALASPEIRDYIDQSFKADEQKAFKGARLHCWNESLDKGSVQQRFSGGCVSKKLGRKRSYIFDFAPGQSDQFEIGQIDDSVWALSRSEQRKHTLVPFRFRVLGSRGDSVYVTGTVRVHRKMPSDAKIAQVRLAWETVSGKRRYRLSFSISTEREPANNGLNNSAGINLGWRQTQAGALLVATLVDDSGNIERFELPDGTTERARKRDELKATLDNETLELATLWWNRFDDLPSPIAMCFRHWTPRRGISRVDVVSLDKILHDMKRNAVGRVELPDGFAHWHERYRHLSQWRVGDGRAFSGRRRDVYMRFAKDVSKRFGLVSVDDADYSFMAKKAKRKPEDGENPLPKTARANRVVASPHDLVHCIKHQCRKNGARFEKVKAKVTMTCNSCGSALENVDRQKVTLSCESCSSVFDQDINAAKNIWEHATGMVSA